MAKRGFFSHINPEGLDPGARAQALGVNIVVDKGAYESIGLAENISEVPKGNVVGCGYVNSDESVAQCAVTGWLDSPGHHANIVNTEYTETGIGVGYDGQKFLLTQDFR